MTNGDNTPAIDTRYEFLPSVREGYRPNRAYKGGKLTGRTVMGVEVNVQGVPDDGEDWEDAERTPAANLRMYGPGDVTGIDRSQVVRVEPEPHTSTLSPNYFAHVEFDRADLPWLFSPERAGTDDGKAGKTRPWLTLVVVERSNGDVSIEADGTKPLPALTTPVDQLPPVEEVWAWAHVQVVGELSSQELERALVNPSEQVVSRLVCPRNLGANTRYTAAVVPTFEPGVRAGLGKEPFDQGDTAPDAVEVRPAWGRSTDGLVTLPVYYQWDFTTGEEGDFESLARKLEPERLDEYDVGVREVDLQDPGPAKLATDSLTRQVGGALQSAGLETEPYPERRSDAGKREDAGKRKKLRDLLNSPEDAGDAKASNVPALGPPIYGQWYLPEDAGWELGETGVPEPPGLPESSTDTPRSTYFGSWLHDLNLDPQYRLPASYGTEVVQENQEQLMEAAWKMFGDLEEANRQLGTSQAADLVGGGLSEHLERVDTTRFAQRVMDPQELHRKIQTYDMLRDQGLFALGDGIDEVMSGEVAATDLTEGVDTPEGFDLSEGGALGGADVSEEGGIGGVDPGAVDSSDMVGGVSDRWGQGFGTAGQGEEVDEGVRTGGGNGVFEDESLGRTGTAVDERFNSAVGGAVGGVQEKFAKESGEGGPLGDDIATDGAGAIEMVDTALQTARMAEVHSSSFRRLTRKGGKLARGVELGSEASEVAVERANETFTFDAAGALGHRFGGGSPAGRQSADSAQAQTGAGDQSGDAPPQAAPSPTQTDWRVDDAGNVLSLEKAIDRNDGPLVTVPQALLAVESVRDHCDTVRDRLEDLDTELTALQRSEEGAARAVVDSLTERPTVGEQCRAVGRNTFDALARQLGKLVAADPEPLAGEFTEERRAQVLEQLHAEHGHLVTAVDEAADTVRAEQFDPAALRDRVGTARDALGGLSSVLDTVESHVDSGIPPGAGEMSAMSGEMSAMSGEMSAMSGEMPAMADELQGVEYPGPSQREAESDEGPTTEMMALSVEVENQLLQGVGDMPGVLDASGWSKQAAAWRLNPGVTERDVELAPVLAAPEFEQPMYRWLKRVDQTYLLPGAEEVPRNSVGAVETSSTFIESFMCGLNHEMARELLWRKFPTDRRGTYFRQFWDYIGVDDQPDIQKLHRWRDSPLGKNRAGDVPTNRVVLLIRGELLDAYPNTRIYAVKAVREDRSEGSGGEDDEEWDRMPLLEQKRRRAIDERERGVRESEQTLKQYDKSQLEKWGPKQPVFRGKLDPGLTFLGFDLASAEAEGETTEETDDLTGLGWFFVLEEPVGETRFGLDVASAGDYGSVPFGVRHGSEGDGNTSGERAIEKAGGKKAGGEENGWNGLSWGHLVDGADALDAKEFVTVGEDNPAGGGDPPWAVEEGDEWSTEHDETFTYQDAAQWGYNSAHMANITWQLPVRVCIHADDILPDMDEEGGDRATESLRFELDPSVQRNGGGGD